MRVLVFGSTGQVAQALARAKWPKGTTLTSLDRQAADFSQPETLGAIVRQHAPDVVIIAAAYTAVDEAESEEALATTVNAARPARSRARRRRSRVPVVHLSTDYVFDGEKGRSSMRRTIRSRRSTPTAARSSRAKSPCARPIRGI